MWIRHQLFAATVCTGYHCSDGNDTVRWIGKAVIYQRLFYAFINSHYCILWIQTQTTTFISCNMYRNLGQKQKKIHIRSKEAVLLVCKTPLFYNSFRNLIKGSNKGSIKRFCFFKRRSTQRILIKCIKRNFNKMWSNQTLIKIVTGTKYKWFNFKKKRGLLAASWTQLSCSLISNGLTAIPMGHFAPEVHVYILCRLNQEVYIYGYIMGQEEKEK